MDAVRLGTAILAYTVRAASTRGEPLIVRIDAPAWTRFGEPAEQGVCVDRITVAPVAPVR
jgi:hypothetical protein